MSSIRLILILQQCFFAAGITDRSRNTDNI